MTFFSRFSRRVFASSVALLFVASNALCFPHVIQKGETLASLADRFYGRVQMERILVTANSLDQGGLKGVSPGMIIDIPAITYRQVLVGETWKSLATELLGEEYRYVLLAEVNGQKPWIEPELGQIIKVPYNLAWLATGEESLSTLAYRFLGSTKHAFRLVQYNDLDDGKLVRGKILLLPLSDLTLTPDGRAAAERAAAQVLEQSHGDYFESQRESREEAKLVFSDVRAGRYVSAVARGQALLAAGKLSDPSRADLSLLLLEAYVALDATGLARTACESFRTLAPETELDPLTTSPKILRVCPPRAKEEPTRSPPADEPTDEQ